MYYVVNEFCHVVVLCFVFFFSSRRRHTRCALVTGVQTCALPIFGQPETGQLRVRCGTHAGTVRLAHVIRACYPNRRASPLLLTSICVWLPSSAVASARISAQNGSFGAMLNTGSPAFIAWIRP